MRTISAEIDDATAVALDDLVRQEGRPRSQIAAAAVKAFVGLAPAARLALFAIEGLATEDERAAAMAFIGQMAIEAYQGMLATRQRVGTADEEANIEALLAL